MENKLIVSINMDHLSEEVAFSKQDVVMIEEPLQINTLSSDGNISQLSITMRTPGNDAELA